MTSKKHHLSIIEDDDSAVFIYRETLGKLHELRFFPDLTSFRKAERDRSRAFPTDLLIADLTLPDGNFLDFLGTDEGSELITYPFLVISSCDDLDVLRTCFEEGALDYLIKPFTKNELIAKTERILEQGAPTLKLDPSSHSLKLGKKVVVELTTKEFQLLYILQRSLGEKVPRKRLYEGIWKGVSVSDKALDVHIFNLRRKLKGLPLHIKYVAPGSFMLLSDGMNPEIEIV